MPDKRAGGLPSYDGDSTNELPQADRTIAISPSRTASADKTTEVEAADVLSVGFHAEPPAPQGVAPARTTVPPPRSLRPPASFDMPFLPTLDADPFALPSAPPRIGPAAIRVPAESTVEVRKAAGIPSPGSTGRLLAALAVCALVAALILGVLLVTGPGRAP